MESCIYINNRFTMFLCEAFWGDKRDSKTMINGGYLLAQGTGIAFINVYKLV